jgi:iron complex outermembrane receptor protein
LTLNIGAQQKLSGLVTTSEKEPLIGVQVYIDELQSGTTTDENGFYEIVNLPNTILKITVLYIGFESQSRTISLHQNETTINFVLKESIFKLDEIILSTPFHKLQSENVMKVERTTLQNLDGKGTLTLIEGLSNIPGVSQVSTGIGIGKPVIRGLRGNRVLVYSQGIRLENQQFGDEHGLGINDFSIESIEVIKGPASLLYGSDALGGVLYFNPIKFAPKNDFEASIRQKYFSNTLGSSTSIGLKKSFNQWKFLLNATTTGHADYQIPVKNRLRNSRFKEKTVNGGIAFNGEFLSTKLRFIHNNSNIGIPDKLYSQSKNKTPLLPNQNITNNLFSLNSILFISKSKLNAMIGFTDNQRNEFEEEEPSTASLGLDLKTWSYDLKWYFPKTDLFETVIGIQGLAQKNSNFGEEILIPDAAIDDIGALITSSFTWNKNSLMAGVRYDTREIKSDKHIIFHENEEHIFESIDNSYNNISVSLGLKSILFGSITSRMNIASGFKAPNLAELTSNGVHHGTNRFEIGNGDLSSEKNVQWDLSLDYQSDHFEIYSNGFYNHVNDYIFISPTGDTEDDYFVFNYIQDDAKLYGGEFGLHLHPHPLDRLHFKSDFELVIGKQRNGDFLPLIPANKWNNEFRIDFLNDKLVQNKYAAISLEIFSSQNRVSQFETKTSGYQLINIQSGGTFKLKSTNIIMTLSIRNLFNRSYISHLSRLKNNGIPNMGRNFTAGLTWNF